MKKFSKDPANFMIKKNKIKTNYNYPNKMNIQNTNNLGDKKLSESFITANSNLQEEE